MTNKQKRTGGAGDKRSGQGRGGSDKGKGRKVYITPPKKSRGPGRTR